MNTWERLTDTYQHKSATIREFNKRYENTFLAFETETKETKYLRYLYCNTDDDIYSFVFKLSKNQEFFIPYNHPFINEKLYVPTIKKGFYYTYENNPLSSILYVAQFPQRQWLRGIATCNYNIINYTAYLQNKLSFSDSNYYALYNILKQQDNEITVTPNIFLLCDKNKHIIINNNFLLTQNVQGLSGYSLFFHKYLIGTFINPTTFRLNNTLFLQEFLEEKRNWNINFSIEN